MHAGQRHKLGHMSASLLTCGTLSKLHSLWCKKLGLWWSACSSDSTT